jgi:hypothetical protein
VADLNNHRIRMIKDGIVSTFAGAGQPGCVDGPAESAHFQKPYGLAIDRFGTIYVGDQHNHRMIFPPLLRVQRRSSTENCLFFMFRH